MVDATLVLQWLTAAAAFSWRPYQAPSICEGVPRHALCRPAQVQSGTHATLSEYFHFAMPVTPGTWTEGGTLFLRLSFFETIDSFHYPISTDQGDINIMRREAGHADVVEEGYLPVPCEMSSVPPRHRLWHLKVTDHAHYALDHTWVNTTRVFGPFHLVPSECF